MNIKVGDLVTIREDLQRGKYGADSVVDDMLKYCGKSFKVASVRNDGKKVDLEGVPWNWTPEMLEDKPSGKIVAYRCLKNGGKDNWWTEGKIYEVFREGGQEGITDNEGDERFFWQRPFSEFLEYLRDDYGAEFIPIYEKAGDEDLIERIKKEIERLNKDQENLFGKRDRINGQAIQLGVKARKLEEVLEVLEKYK